MRLPRLASLAVLLFAAGCGGQKSDVVPVPDSHAVTPAGREWWKVYSVEFQGDRKIRTHMGHLYRQVNPRDPKSENYFVLDRVLRQVGFILASDYRAFVLVEPRPPLVKATTQQVSLGDLSNGVKRILQCPGTVELEKENLGSSAAPKAPPTVSAR